MTSLKIQGKLDESFFTAWSHPVLYRIQSDYEEFSSLQICRYLMKESIALAYPIFKAPYFFSSILLSTGQLKTIESTLRLQARKAAQMDNWASVCFAPQQAMSFWVMHVLLESKFELVSLDALESLSVLRRGQGDLHGDSFAVTVERCTVSADGGCILHLKVNLMRLKSFDFPTRSDETAAGQIDIDNNKEGILLFSGEQVTAKEAYRLSLHSNSKRSAVLPMTNESLLHQGFGSFYPTNTSQFLHYWDLIAGWKAMPNDKTIQAIRVVDGTRERIVPVDLISRFLIVSPKNASDAVARVEPTLCEALQSAALLRDVQFQQEPAHVQFDTAQQPPRFLRASALRSKKTVLIKDDDLKDTSDGARCDPNGNQAKPSINDGRKRPASLMSSSETQPTLTLHTIPSSKAKVTQKVEPSRVLRVRAAGNEDKQKRVNRVAAKSVSSKQGHQVPDENVAPSEAPQSSGIARDEEDWLFGDDGF